MPLKQISTVLCTEKLIIKMNKIRLDTPIHSHCTFELSRTTTTMTTTVTGDDGDDGNKMHSRTLVCLALVAHQRLLPKLKTTGNIVTASAFSKNYSTFLARGTCYRKGSFRLFPCNKFPDNYKVL